MQYSTRKRSLLKTVSWRTVATITTATLVYVFTGAFALAVTVGGLEVIAKMMLYFFHERAWEKIKYGKKEIPSFVVWITGLPASGKREIADALTRRLKDGNLKVERIDSRGVRPLFPETGFAPDEVDHHVRRVGHLCSILEKNGVITVASFVSPYLASRRFARGMTTNFVEVYLRTTPEACGSRDRRRRYEKARTGQFQYFPGVHVPYEEADETEVVVDVDNKDVDEAVDQIEAYLKKNFINQN